MYEKGRGVEKKEGHFVGQVPGVGDPRSAIQTPTLPGWAIRLFEKSCPLRSGGSQAMVDARYSPLSNLS